MSRKTISFLAAAAVVVALGIQPMLVVAQEDEPCEQRSQLVNSLSVQYQESPRAIGLVSQDAVVEVFVSASGSWTVLVTNTAGVSCILAAGQYWEEIPLASAPGVTSWLP